MSDLNKRRKPAIKGEDLPPDLASRRVLPTEQAAVYCGYSIPQWRELYRRNAVPPPIKLSARKYGWRISTLDGWLEAKSQPNQAA